MMNNSNLKKPDLPPNLRRHPPAPVPALPPRRGSKPPIEAPHQRFPSQVSDRCQDEELEYEKFDDSAYDFYEQPDRQQVYTSNDREELKSPPNSCRGPVLVPRREVPLPPPFPFEPDNLESAEDEETDVPQDYSYDPPSKPPAESSGFRVTDTALNAAFLKMRKNRISHNRSGDSIEGCSDIPVIGTSLSDAPPCPPSATDNQIKSNNQRNSSGSNSPGGPPIPAVRVSRQTQQPVDSPHPGAPGNNFPEIGGSRLPPRVPMVPVAPTLIPTNVISDENDMSTHPWFFGEIGRREGDMKVLKKNIEGVFLVRTSHSQEDVPYVLCLHCGKQARNIQIRKRKDGKFALGSFKSDENVFDSVAGMIQFHYNNAVEVKEGGAVRMVKLVNAFEK